MVVLEEKFNSTFLLVFAILQSVLGNLAIMRKKFWLPRGALEYFII